MKNSTTGELEHVFYPIVVGYEAWNYLAFLLLPILYICIRCKVKIKVSHYSYFLADYSVVLPHHHPIQLWLLLQ